MPHNYLFKKDMELSLDRFHKYLSYLNMKGNFNCKGNRNNHLDKSQLDTKNNINFYISKVCYFTYYMKYMLKLKKYRFGNLWSMVYMLS